VIFPEITEKVYVKDKYPIPRLTAKIRLVKHYAANSAIAEPLLKCVLMKLNEINLCFPCCKKNAVLANSYYSLVTN